MVSRCIVPGLSDFGWVNPINVILSCVWFLDASSPELDGLYVSQLAQSVPLEKAGAAVCLLSSSSSELKEEHRASLFLSYLTRNVRTASGYSYH